MRERHGGRRNTARHKDQTRDIARLHARLATLWTHLGALSATLESDPAASLRWECLQLLAAVGEAESRGHLSPAAIMRVEAFSRQAIDWIETCAPAIVRDTPRLMAPPEPPT